MTTNFRDIIDKPDWRIIAPQLNIAATGGALAYDEQNGDERFLGVFQLVSNTVLNFYNPVNDGSTFIGSPALAGTFGAGANCVYMPSAGPRGTIAAGATTTQITPSATIGASIPQNRLSSRGIIGVGFKIRIIDNGAGGSGKTEERTIIGNTAGTTPLIKLDTPLSFIPVSGSSYELLSGRVFLLGSGLLAAGAFKYFDIALGTFSGNLSIANLPATLSTDSQMSVLDETYNPDNMESYAGFLGRIIASAVTATTIAGTAIPNVSTTAGVAGGPLANQFRNFQIRIVEDTTTPTAVGQRQIIASHTAGTAAVFTIYAAWTVQPSNTCKFVIEYPNEIIYRGSASTSTFSYAPFLVRNNATLTTAGAQADTWSAVRYAASSAAPGAGSMMWAGFGFPIGNQSKDPLLLHRHSNIFQFRGGGSTALDLFDIAGGTTGLWENTKPYMTIGSAFGTGSTVAYDPVGEDGKFAYINLNGSQFFYRFNMLTMDIGEWTYLRQSQGVAAVGGRLWTGHAKDKDGNKISTLGYLSQALQLQHELFITT